MRILGRAAPLRSGSSGACWTVGLRKSCRGREAVSAGRIFRLKSVWFSQSRLHQRQESASVGSLRARSGLRRGLLPLALSENFPQPFSVGRHARPRRLSHLIGEFNPVHSHTQRIRPFSVVGVFKMEAIPHLAKVATRSTRPSVYLHLKCDTTITSHAPRTGAG